MRPFKFLPAPVTANDGVYNTFVKSAVSSQAGLQALIHHRVERPTVTSYARTISHPPIFGALAQKASPYGPVAQLARRLAVTYPNRPTDRLDDEIAFLLKAGQYRTPSYQEPTLTPPEDLWGSPEGAYE